LLICSVEDFLKTQSLFSFFLFSPSLDITMTSFVLAMGRRVGGEGGDVGGS
jgi:hypothetical protein